MRILISKTVEKDIYKVFSSQNSINLLVKKVKAINIENIYLKRPFVKIKVSILSINFRIIWEFKKLNWILTLILLFKKSNKKYWTNLVWSDDIEKLVLNKLENIQKDIINWDYKLY